MCGAPLAAGPATREERKVVTVLFCDLVGFTAKAEQLDPEDVRAVLGPTKRASKRGRDDAGDDTGLGGTASVFVDLGSCSRCGRHAAPCSPEPDRR
jgi:class 3 adenylate cyclase